MHRARPPDRGSRANRNSPPLRYLIFRGSIPHPMQSLCTLRNHCRQRSRNTRYQAGAAPYLGRTYTGWIAPALPGALQARGRCPAHSRIHLFVRRGLSEGRDLRLSDHADIEYDMLPGLPWRPLAKVCQAGHSLGSRRRPHPGKIGHRQRNAGVRRLFE
jgi:hypothetical protein